MCSAMPSCINGTACTIAKCAPSGTLPCYVDCFNGQIDQIVIGVTASQCVYTTCGTVCVSP